MSADSRQVGVQHTDARGSAATKAASLAIGASDDHHTTIELVHPGGMSSAASDQFTRCVKDFGMALARETSRLEEAERAESIQEPEITATMVIKANEQVRNPNPDVPAPVPPGPLAAQIVALPAAILAGIFGSHLNSDWQWLTMVIAFVLAVIAQGYAIIALRRRR